MTTRGWQLGVFAMVTVVAVAGWHVSGPDAAVEVWILVAAVALLGLPHGAFDLPIAERIWPLRGVSGLLRFSGVYLGLAAAVILVWIALPGLALGLFLAYSAVHFSTDWDDQPMLWRVAGGLSTIGAPALAHRAEVERIFSLLATPEAGAALAPVLAAGSLLGLAAFLGSLAGRRQLRPIAELALIWVAAFALPPLLYFVVYFCGLHSLRHLATALSDVSGSRRALGQAALVTAVTLFGAILAASVLLQPQAMDEAAVKTVFIGLAALTVPHMLLVEHWSRRRPR